MSPRRPKGARTGLFIASTMAGVLLAQSPAWARVDLPDCDAIQNHQAVARQSWGPDGAPFGTPYASWTASDFADLAGRVADCGGDAAYVRWQATLHAQHYTLEDLTTAPPLPPPSPQALAPEPAAQAPAAPSFGPASDFIAAAVPSREATESIGMSQDEFTLLSLSLGVLIGMAIYMIPTIVAFWRKHAYAWVIAGVNLFGGWTGAGWIVAFVWAVWPTEKALLDPLIGNVTGVGVRNAGDAVGAAQYGVDRGRTVEAATAPAPEDRLAILERLARLRDQGALSEEEFQAEKTRLG